MEGNKENLKLWVKELREGGHKQGQGFLCIVKDDGSTEHCCLDVAHLAAMKAGVELSRGEPKWDAAERVIKTEGSIMYLATKVSQWLGIRSGDPDLLRFADADPIEDYDSATKCNDKLGLSFDEIADRIEYTYGLRDEK